MCPITREHFTVCALCKQDHSPIQLQHSAGLQLPDFFQVSQVGPNNVLYSQMIRPRPWAAFHCPLSIFFVPKWFLNLSLTFMTLMLWRRQASYHVTPLNFGVSFLTVRFRLFTFVKNVTDTMLSSSHCTLSGAKWCHFVLLLVTLTSSVVKVGSLREGSSPARLLSSPL